MFYNIYTFEKKYSKNYRVVYIITKSNKVSLHFVHLCNVKSLYVNLYVNRNYLE